MRYQLETAILKITKSKFEEILLSKSRLENCRITDNRIHLRYRQVDYVLTTNADPQGQLSASLWRGEHSVWNRNLRLEDPDVFDVIADKSHRAATHDSGVANRLMKLQSHLDSKLEESPNWFTECTATVAQTKLRKDAVEALIVVSNPKLRILGIRDAGVSVEVPLNGRERLHCDIPVRLMALQNGRLQSFIEPFDCPIEQYCQWFDKRLSRDLTSLTLPFESLRYAPEAKQALLVLVPLRLADEAKVNNQVDWCRELISACTCKIAARPDSPQRIIRELFFQLLQLQLANEEDTTTQLTRYRQIGKRLAEMRCKFPDMPYNPVLCYEKWVRGSEDVILRVPDQVQRELKWFIQESSLERIVEAMGLL